MAEPEGNSEVDRSKDDELLLPWEQQNLRGDYKNYLTAKRQNYRANLQNFPALWDCFLSLDETFVREFLDLQRISPQSLLPSHLFRSSHAGMRVALELAFSACIYDAQNVVRSAIELAAHAYHIHRNPRLNAVWRAKDKRKAEFNAYRDAFERDKEKTLFHGLKRLHKYSGMFSETGTHSTISGMSLRHKFETTGDGTKLIMHFFETDPRRIGPFLVSILTACRLIEDALFSCFRARLDLDPQLVEMRTQFEQRKARATTDLIQRFNIPRPTIIT